MADTLGVPTEISSRGAATAGGGTVTITFTWRGFYRVCFGVVAEGAMLALIFESSRMFMAATLICALAGLGLLQFEGEIKRWNRRVFRFSIITASMIYVCFVVYAISHVIYQSNTRNGLEERYIEAAELFSRQIPLNAEKKHMDADEVAQFQRDVDAWQAKTGQWMLRRISVVAVARFLDRSGFTDLMWPQQNGSDPVDPVFRSAINELASDRKNLAIILETRAYDN